MDDFDLLTPAQPSVPDLIAEVEAQRNLMVAVATGGPRINDVNVEYGQRRERIRSKLTILGIDDPNPHEDLWAWYGKWSSDLPSYQSRRAYVRELLSPLLERLSQVARGDTTGPLREPTGWARVDRGLDKARDQLARGRNEEDFQGVGLYCRETLISLAQAVYDPNVHAPDGEPVPSETDAKRMLEGYVSSNLAGGNNEAPRNHAKAALKLANDLVHRRTASFRDAALCAEATSSVVNIIAIVSGRRDPG